MINELSKMEGKWFLNLVYRAIMIDDMIYDKEEDAFISYTKKLGFECSLDDFKTISLEDTIDLINTLENRKKKIIFAEVLGVLFSDDIYDDTEKKFIYQVGSSLGFSNEDVLAMEQAVLDYIVAYGTLMDVVNQ